MNRLFLSSNGFINIKNLKLLNNENKYYLEIKDDEVLEFDKTKYQINVLSKTSNFNKSLNLLNDLILDDNKLSLDILNSFENVKTFMRKSKDIGVIYLIINSRYHKNYIETIKLDKNDFIRGYKYLSDYQLDYNFLDDCSNLTSKEAYFYSTSFSINIAIQYLLKFIEKDINNEIKKHLVLYQINNTIINMDELIRLLPNIDIYIIDIISNYSNVYLPKTLTLINDNNEIEINSNMNLMLDLEYLHIKKYYLNNFNDDKTIKYTEKEINSFLPYIYEYFNNNLLYDNNEYINYTPINNLELPDNFNSDNYDYKIRNIATSLLFEDITIKNDKSDFLLIDKNIICFKYRRSDDNYNLFIALYDSMSELDNVYSDEMVSITNLDNYLNQDNIKLDYNIISEEYNKDINKILNVLNDEELNIKDIIIYSFGNNIFSLLHFLINYYEYQNHSIYVICDGISSITDLDFNYLREEFNINIEVYNILQDTILTTRNCYNSILMNIQLTKLYDFNLEIIRKIFKNSYFNLYSNHIHSIFAYTKLINYLEDN